MKAIAWRMALALALALSFAGAAAAQGRFGAWHTGVLDGGQGLFAATVNDSGHVLGQYCYPGRSRCVYLLGMPSACMQGHRYPVLMNSDVGSLELELLCNGALDAGIYQYVFADFDSIDGVIRKASRIGFAFPLEGDAFKVVQFDLGGSSRAIAVMRSAARALARKAPSPQPPADTI